MVKTSAMSEERFKTLVEAYGGDPARWPRAEREAGERLLASSAMAQSAVADADKLDHALSVAIRVLASDILESRVMTDFDRAARRWSSWKFVASIADAVWPGAPLWQPACAFGLALAIGVGVAALAPLDIRQSDDSPNAAFAFETVPDAGADQGI